MARYVKVEIRKTSLTYLPCLACGGFLTEFEVVTAAEPVVGLHRRCVDAVKVRRVRKSKSVETEPAAP